MTTCAQITEWISERIDGELDATRDGPLSDHLEGCAACRETLAALERLAIVTERLPRAVPRDRGVLALNTTLHELARKPRRTEFGPVMDMEELAEFLRVPIATVGQYLDELPSFELGGKLLFRRTRVEQWIARREHRIDPPLPLDWIETAGSAVN